VKKKRITRLTTLLYSIEFSDYGATIVSEQILYFIHSAF